MNKRGLKALQWAQTQKFLKNSHQGRIKNNELILKTWKKGNNETKRKAFQQNIERRYQKPLGHPLILGTSLHAKHPHLKLLAKKNERGKAKGDAKDLNAIKRGNKIQQGEWTQKVN